MQEPGPPGWGSLRIETSKYGRERGTQTRERLRSRGPATTENDRPDLSSEREHHIKTPVTDYQI
jgi:hypothetical protein